MKVWELEEGVEYIRYLRDNTSIKYMISEGILNYFNEINNSWCITHVSYNDIKDVDFIPITPPTDWSKVEVDTKVWVRNKESEDWNPRHFARYDKENNTIHCYISGETSFTTKRIYTYPWKYAKLHTD